MILSLNFTAGYISIALHESLNQPYFFMLKIISLISPIGYKLQRSSCSSFYDFKVKGVASCLLSQIMYGWLFIIEEFNACQETTQKMRP